MTLTAQEIASQAKVLVTCAYCNGKGTRPGDPEAAPTEECQPCGGSGKRSMRMDGYYIGFARTGVREIDIILSAVACAGKAYHHTESWTDECAPYHELHRGTSPVDWIQNAAEDAATRAKSAEQENKRLKAALEEALDRYIAMAKENKRLRYALENITYLPDSWGHRDVARAALKPVTG